MNRTGPAWLLSGIILLCGCGNELHGESGGSARQWDRSSNDKEVPVHEIKSGKWSPELTDDEKETLFRIGEDTLRWCVAGGKEAFDFSAYTLTPKLKERMATFVTLKTGDRLRGCIGSLEPVAELYKSVHDNAVNAALRDFRFKPVAEAELGQIDMHVSILSPIREIPSPDAFQIGEHGIIIEKGMHRAVYLPEVAVEQEWGREEALSSLSMKAGMRPDAWKEGTRFKVFSSVVLHR